MFSRDRPLVAGSIGPYGACQFDKSEYHGNYVDKMSMEVSKQIKINLQRQNE